MKKTSLVFIAIIFSTANIFGQSWVSEDNKSWHLRHQFYHDLKVLFKGVDSAYYMLTDHRPPQYWKEREKNKNSSELLISRIDEQGKPNFIIRLDKYAEKPVLKCFNGKYYLLDNFPKYGKGTTWCSFFIYNDKWQLESEFNITDQSHQRGYSDFVVDKAGNIFLMSDPYFIDHHPQDFNGCFLLKYSPTGTMIQNIFFEKSYSPGIEIANNELFFSVQTKKMKGDIFYETDSVYEISCSNDLVPKVTSAKKFIPGDRKIETRLVLTDGDQVHYIDSTYSIGRNASTSDHRIVMLDKEGNRRWVIEREWRWIFFEPHALPNGSFIARVDRQKDSSRLIIFDKKGGQRPIFGFREDYSTTVNRFKLEEYFIMSEKEIWVFYKKEEPHLQEELYFERVFY